MSDENSVAPLHPIDFIEEELAYRGWTLEDVALMSGGPEEYGRRLLCFELYSLREPGVLLDEETAGWLSQALGTSPQLWLRLDAAWQAANPRTDSEPGSSRPQGEDGQGLVAPKVEEAGP